MNERRLRFGIGVFVLAALVTLGALVYMFGGHQRLFAPRNFYTAVFPEAPGVGVGTPVTRSGVRIGEVDRVELDDTTGDVLVGLALEKKYLLRKGDLPTVTQGLLGEATVEIVAPKPGAAPADRSPVAPGDVVTGASGGDPRDLFGQASEMVPAVNETMSDVRRLSQSYERLAPQMEQAITDYRQLAKATNELVVELRKSNEEFRGTAQTWNKLGTRLDAVVQDNEPRVANTLDNAGAALGALANALNAENRRNLGEALRNFNEAGGRLNTALSDDNQRNLNQSLKNLNSGSARFDSAMQSAQDMFQGSRGLPGRLDDLVTRTNQSLDLFDRAVGPLAESSGRVSANLDTLLCTLNRTAGNLDEFLEAVASQDGTLSRLLTDPTLYNNLNEAACQVTRILPRVDQAIRDVQVFADRIARHPEVLGLGGIVRPGCGIK